MKVINKLVMNLEEAKRIVQEDFQNSYKDLLKKIENSKITGSFSTHIGSYEYDYKKLSEFLNKGFCTEVFEDLFLSLFLLHFSQTVKYEIDIRTYKGSDDHALKETVDQLYKLYQAGDVLKGHAKSLLESIGVKDTKFIEDDKDLLEVLKILSHTKSYELQHFGENAFIVSKIPIQNKPFRMQTLSFDNRIIYTNSPDKIIQMAHVAKPGVYFVANVPYGKMEELSMYLLFRTEEDGYLIDFGKHSYREQIYRNSSKGEEGRARWLWMSIENIFLPAETVLEFFNKESEDKDVAVKDKEFPFRVIAKFDDEKDIVKLWSQYFADECIRQFRDDGVLDEVSPAVSLGFLLPQLSEHVNDNLPAEYKPHIPSVHSLDLSWSPNFIDSYDSYTEGSGAYLATLVQKLPIEKLDLTVFPVESLSSLKQAQGHLVYQKRKQESKNLEKELWEDFGKNFPSVIKRIEEIVRDRAPDKDKFIVKAFEDLAYPLGNYGVKGGGFCEDESPSSEENILFWATDKFPSGTKCTRIGKVNGLSNRYNDIRIINYAVNYDTCGWCPFKSKNKYYLQFIDAMQFMAFFGVSDKEIPKQMLLYLNQNRTLYHGNSILNDVDPLKMVVNPWWTAKKHDPELLNSEDAWSGYNIRCDDQPAIFVRFNTCERCRKKFLKIAGKTDHIVVTEKNSYTSYKI